MSSTQTPPSPSDDPTLETVPIQDTMYGAEQSVHNDSTTQNYSAMDEEQHDENESAMDDDMEGSTTTQQHQTDYQQSASQSPHTTQLNSLIFLQKKLFHLVDQYLNLQTTLKHHLAMQCHKTPLIMQQEAFEVLGEQVQSLLQINQKKANTLIKSRDTLFTEIWMLKNRTHVLRRIVDELGQWIDGGVPMDVEAIQKEIDEKVLLNVESGKGST